MDRQETAVSQHVVEHYEGMLYICSDCGRTEEYDGMAIKIRNPMIDEAECFMCNMVLADQSGYWHGHRTPSEVIDFANP